MPFKGMIMLFPQVIIAQGYALKGSLPEEIQGIDRLSFLTPKGKII